jgi:glycosyltransferase involved in cell wall biosynthesis
MRILEVTCWLAEGPMRGGGATVCWDTARALRDLDHEIRIFTGDYTGAKPRLTVWDDDSGDIPITRLSLDQSDRLRFHWRKHNPEAAPRFGEFLDCWRPDVVHFHSLQGLGFNCLAEATHRHIPTVVTPHDHWWVNPYQFMTNLRTAELLWSPGMLRFLRAHFRRGFVEALREDLTPFCADRPQAFESKSEGSRWAMLREMLLTFGPLRRLLSHAGAVAAPSEFLEGLHGQAGVRHLHVIRNFVDPSCTQVSKRDPAEGPLRFGFMGGTHVWKGVRRALRAVRQFEEGEAELWIWGAEEPRDVPEAKDPRVKWCGRLPVERRHEMQSAMDVLLQLSFFHENCPMAVLESQAARTPIIATRVGGNSELVADGKDGFLVEREDFHGLVSAMRCFVEDRPLVRRFMENAPRRKVGREGAQDLVTLFRKVIHRHAPERR